MPGLLFRDLVAKGTSKQVGEANDWLSEAAKKVTAPDLLKTKEPFRRIVKLSETSIGKMYLFTYDAKLKEKLPFWDMYPLIFPIEYYGDSFLGINLHYLPPMMRASLLDAMMDTINNDKMNKTTKLNIDYRILKGASRYSAFKPCVKKYLFSNVRSNFLYITPEEWRIAVMLPTQRFVSSKHPGITAADVYKKSIG